MGNTPFCTFLSGSTADHFNETDVLPRNGGRELLFRKAEEILKLDAALEKKSWAKYKKSSQQTYQLRERASSFYYRRRT